MLSDASVNLGGACLRRKREATYPVRLKCKAGHATACCDANP